MSRPILRFVLLLPFIPALFACSAKTPQFPDPDELPYRLEQMPGSKFGLGQSIGERILYRDLNGDGRDEMIHWSMPPTGPGNIQIRTIEGNEIAQINYVAQVLQPHFLDYDSNGTLEILVPFMRETVAQVIYNLQ